VPEYVKKVKDKSQGIRLMGFGHRVYKNYDPRAKAMQVQAHAVLDELGLHDDPLLKVAIELERIALQDEYFIEKKLYPNIDFYSGITLRRWASPPPCSPLCSRWRAPWAGLRSGRRCWKTRIRRSAARARSIPARPNGPMCRWRRGNSRTLTMVGPTGVWAIHLPPSRKVHGWPAFEGHDIIRV
jgi:hypothetical protein